jgi:hypothetical protein
MATVTEHLREEIHSYARNAEFAEGELMRPEAERIVADALKGYLGDVEVPRIVLDYFVAEYINVASVTSTA